MFSCSECCKASPCDVNGTQRIPQQPILTQNPAQYQPQLPPAPAPVFSVPNTSAQEKDTNDKLFNNQVVTYAEPAGDLPEPEQHPTEQSKPYPPTAEASRLASEPVSPKVQFAEEPRAEDNMMLAGPPPPAPPPPQPVAARPAEIPDLKEPEGEDSIEYNAAYEYKKAMLAAGCVAVCVFAAFAILLVNRNNFEEPFCADDDWYKVNDVKTPKMCRLCGGGGIVLPIGGEWEQTWNEWLRAVLYLVGLGWCFLGIAIVCDQFMAAIEEITSKKRVVWLKVHGDTKHKFHKKVWNDTVANLSLMALGSSAPEILLSVIELVGNQFFAGELGPSTIVGSAAFNLLVITAVCVAAIPAPETRKIDGLGVFAVTASLSIFAYVWLIVILQLSSPDVVTKTEALLTFAFFPMLVILAYCADKGCLPGLLANHHSEDVHIYDEQQKLRRLYSKEISFETVKMMLDDTSPPATKMTKAQYRRKVMKSFIGGSQASKGSEVTIGFSQAKYMTLECAGIFEVPVKLSQRVDGNVEVRYFTQAGLAAAGKRYQHTEGILVFQPGEVEKMISIPIIDNDVWEEQEDFTICLEDLTGWKMSDKIGYGIRSAKVVILNDDEPGTLRFYVDEVQASSSASSVQVGVSRVYGSTGRISCQYCTVDDSALAGTHYAAAEGELVFEDGVCKASIEIGIMPGPMSASSHVFQVMLDRPSHGVMFDARTDGGREQAICDVIIPGANSNGLANRLKCCACDMHFSASLPDWQGQFVSALYCNGSPADQSTSSRSDWIFHMLSLPFKFVFAFIPPAQVAGGWACFCTALAMIGAVTMVVGDMAALLGCCMDIPDDITAITIVALGTSLPDTFASKSAAVHDPNADNSIGNVTGSNCVNVFLGLGLPWAVGALYWDSQGKTDDWKKRSFKGLNYEEKWGTVCPDGCFLVPAGSLSFSVTVFVATAVSCIALLEYRRKAYGGELGGPAFASKRDACILVGLWLVYIVMSILKSTGAL